MAAPQGLLSFPGIQQIIGGSLTRSHGITPWVCMVQMAPQDQLVKIVGTLSLTFGKVRLDFPESQVDLGSVTRDRGGQVVSLRIVTRQWKWQFGEISGLYNDRTNSGMPIQKREKTPRELAELLFKAMGERGYDYSALPSQDRPLVDWVSANPANELAQIGDTLGCRIVIDLKNRAKFVELGKGAPLPDFEVMSEGMGLNPASRPDIIKLVGGPDVYQSMFLLEAVGEEDDDTGTIKPIDELSYKPTGGWGKESPHNFWGVAPGETAGTKERCRQLALKTVYRLYRIKSQLDGSWRIPGVPGVEVTERKQIVLLKSQIVRAPSKSEDDPPRFKPAEVTGKCYPETWGLKNTDLGSKYDGHFSIDSEPQRQLVEFAKPVYMYESVPDDPLAPDGTKHIEFAPADIRLTTSYNVKHKDTRQLIRSSKEMRLTSSTTGSPLVLPIIYDDVFQSHRATYSATRKFATNPLTNVEELTTTDIVLKKVISNTTEWNEKSGHYLNARAKQFQNVLTGEREYAGIRDDIDLDGAIHQITYTVGQSGASTHVSRNSEHDFDIPPYDQRRASDFAKAFRGK